MPERDKTPRTDAFVRRTGWMMNMGLKGYNDEWRRDRRILHQRFRREAAPTLHPLELAKTQELLVNILQNPKELTSHFKTYAVRPINSLSPNLTATLFKNSFPTSIMFYLLYGHHMTAKDPLVDITYEALEMFSGSVVPGTLIVNVFPFRTFPTCVFPT
jgi:hypothetical protein